MAAACGVTVIKRFTYRGDPTEEYSNTYWFTGAAPATSTLWRTLFDALVTQEKTCYQAAVNVVRGYGYNDDSGHKGVAGESVAPAAWTVDLTVAPNTIVPGTGSFGSVYVPPGDLAVWLRWKTSRLSVKGKPIYLRKYFHPAYLPTSGSGEAILPAQSTALLALGAKLRDGSFLDSRTVTAPGHTDVLVGHGVSSWLTTRTLKRRGKRPGS